MPKSSKKVAVEQDDNRSDTIFASAAPYNNNTSSDQELRGVIRTGKKMSAINPFLKDQQAHLHKETKTTTARARAAMTVVSAGGV
jgi:hypothetical protein